MTQKEPRRERTANNKKDNLFYNVENMRPEFKYQFRDKFGIEITAYVNSERTVIEYFVSNAPNFRAREVPMKHHMTLQNFAYKIEQEKWRQII